MCGLLTVCACVRAYVRACVRCSYNNDECMYCLVTVNVFQSSISNNHTFIMEYCFEIGPLAVTGLNAVAVSNSDVKVSWAPSNNSHQNAYRLNFGDSTASAWKKVITVNGLEKTVTGLNAGKTYTFDVTAVSKMQISSATTTTSILCKYRFDNVIVVFLNTSYCSFYLLPFVQQYTRWIH